ncbi:MAG TPA: potassium transporter TrkA [Firmicutes bacterium]|mgnify:CR=1 FL=1|nr:potassium transporter TrkA [Bacillota bacterium]HBX25460.1 potassium transporter TrkA [Bacillota bacterium]
MKIVIAGGNEEAEFIIKMFSGKGDDLIVINPSKEMAEIILKRCKIPVYVGSPWRKFALDEANAYDADAFISLCQKDTDNYATCQLAKKCFNAKKCVCLVNNPKNVDVYKKLGIDSVISSSYLLGQSVKNESSVESIMETLSLENDKIVMIEALVLSRFPIANKSLKEIGFPPYASISCIYRTPEVIIPKGDTIIRPKDKLLIVCTPNDQKKVMAFIKGEKEVE